MQLFKQRAQFDKLKYKLLARWRNTPDKSKNTPSLYNVCPFCTKAAPRRRDTNTKNRSNVKKRNPPQSPFCQCSQFVKDSSKLTCAVCNVSGRKVPGVTIKVPGVTIIAFSFSTTVQICRHQKILIWISFG